MLGLMGFSGSLPLYVIHRYYITVTVKWACLLTCLQGTGLNRVQTYTQ